MEKHNKFHDSPLIQQDWARLDVAVIEAASI